MTPSVLHFLKWHVGIYMTISILFFNSCAQKPDVPDYGWFEFAVTDLDTTRNEIDLSFLNEDIAGASGFVSVENGHFVTGSGKRVRFFGTNLTFSSCFPEKETATSIAARLSKMGMNVVRFHHLDMRATPAGIWDSTMLKFDPSQVNKLDWLIYQLKMHGIYSNINLHVSRTYPGSDFDTNLFRFGKSLDHFYPLFIEMQKEYARELLTHENPYTGTRYIEEPAIAFVELNNENSLLSNWKQLAQLDGELKNSLLQQWRAFLQTKGSGMMKPDLFKIINGYEGSATNEEIALLWEFLVETEMNYASEMTEFVKDELKSKSLLTGSQASYSGIAGIHREATYSDFIDMHAYWEHPSFPGESWSRTNWLIRNSSMVTDKNAGTLARFGQHRVEGMPLTISEYDHPAPNFFCAEMYPMFNSVAAFQDWDGIYHFTFDGGYDEGKIHGFFSSAGHPLKQVFIPVGSILFRMNAVKTGEQKVQLQLPQDAVIPELVEYGNILRLHGSNMHDVWEKAGAPKALSILHPFAVTLSGDEVKLTREVEEPDSAWISETEELNWYNRDSLQSVFTINTPTAKAAVGYIGEKEIKLGDVTFEMDSTEWNWATITLTSMDGKPISNSSSVLLVAAGRVENTDMGWNEDMTSVSSEWGDAPSRAEGIPAIISFENMDRFKAFALDANGNRTNEIQVFRSEGKRTVVIGSQHNTLWYILSRK